jgi:ribosome-associated protein
LARPPSKKGRKAPARDLAVAAATIARDDNAEDIVVLDLRGVSPVTDYFVIATGTSDRQMRAIGDEIAGHAKAVGQPVWHVAGRDSAEWVLLDFVDVVVHLFDEDHRRYYDLETLWGEAPRVDWCRSRARRPGTER